MADFLLKDFKTNNLSGGFILESDCIVKYKRLSNCHIQGCVIQLAEIEDLKSLKYGFKFHHSYQKDGSIPSQLAEGRCEGSKVQFLMIVL